MSKGIRLHKEFGLNPTMPVCFWCGEETGEVALMGAHLKGEAPRTMVVNLDPCEKCAAKWAEGIAIIEATEPGRPTGRYMIATPISVSMIVTDSDTRERVLREKIMMVSVETFNRILPKEILH